MMLDGILFLAGVQLGMWMIASLYALLDLHGVWRAHWRSATTRIVIAFGAFILVWPVFGASARPIVYGAAGFAIFYLLANAITRATVSWVYRQRRRNPSG